MLTQIPALSARIADQYAKSYIEQKMDQSSQTTGSARKFIEEQVTIVKQKLQESEEELVRYAREQEITITGENTTPIQATMSAVNASISAVEKERLDYDSLVRFIEQGRGSDLPQVLENEAVRSVRIKLTEWRAEYQEKLATLKPAFPEMRALQTKISEMERQLARTVSVITDTIRIKREEHVAREASMRARLAQLEKEYSAFQDKNIRYTILKREVDSNRSQYQSLITKLNDLGVGSEIRSPTATLIDSAVASSQVATPILWINLAIFMFITIVLTAAVVYVLEMLSNKFTLPEQVEFELKLPVLGIIPMMGQADLRESLEDHASPISEAYRSLRTSLQFTGHDGMPKTVMVTSTEPSEGKSTTIFKLAVDLGALGERVLVIDADMRKPSMHRHFVTDHAIGLSNLLANSAQTASMHDFFRPTKFTNVTFLSAGTIPPNAPDLLSSPRMALLLKTCAERFDVIVIDAPPVIGLADAPVLSRLTEATLIVISANQVARKAARNAVKRINTAGGVAVGVALTKFSVDRFDYANSYRYMGGYNYNGYVGYGGYNYYAYGTRNPAVKKGPGDGKIGATGAVHRALGQFSRRVRGAAGRLLDRGKSAA